MCSLNDNENDDSNLSTVGQEERNKKENKPTVAEKADKTIEKGKKIADAAKSKKGQAVIKFIAAHAVPILIIIGIILLVFLIIGLVFFIGKMPGLFIENIKEYSNKIWTNVSGFFTGDTISPGVTDEDQLALAERIQKMGYDIVGYGFGDAQYIYDDTSEGKEMDGVTNGQIKSITSLADSRDYLKAYIAQSEATYTLANWNVKGFFASIWNGINSLGEDSRDAKAYSRELINVNQQHSINGLKIGIDRTNRRLMMEYTRMQIFAWSIKDTYYFDMSNWTARYGKPLELFLSLHLSTMMPDLAYNFAVEDCFNTKVNIDLQAVKATYKVIYTNENGEEKNQNDILKLYLKTVYGLNDTEIKRFEDAGKLEQAYETIKNNIGLITDSYFGMYEGCSIDVTGNHNKYKGFNLANVEKSVLGQEYSIFNVTKTEEIEVPVEIGGGSTMTNNGNSAAATGQDPANNTNTSSTTTKRKRTIQTKEGKRVRVRDITADADAIQADFNGTGFEGLNPAQLEELISLILAGKKKNDTYLPRISSVTNHWYYDTITFSYGQAKRAKKKISYTPEEGKALASLPEGSLILDTTFRANDGSSGVYYQLTEPEADGPNEAIVALFKGGSGTFNGVSYSFDGKYYRYDGTRDTAFKIANAKAVDENGAGSEFTFLGETYTAVDPNSNDEIFVEKQPVTFATGDEDGNKSYTDAYNAFSILENTHTEEAETVYRNFRDLLVNLNYFSKEDFMKPLTQVLLWPVKDVKPANLTNKEEANTEGIEKDVNNYGLILRNGKAFNAGDEIIAPGDATVESIEDGKIKLKFKSLSQDVAESLGLEFGSDYKSVDYDIILDMEMTISGINPNVSAGSTINRGDTLGTATGEDIKIIMYNTDKSLVENIEDYMYPSYKGTKEDDFGQGGGSSSDAISGSDSDSSSSGSSSSSSYYNPDYDLGVLGNTEQQVYSYLTSNGLTKAGACAVMGCIRAESGFNPGATNRSDGGYGLLQWTYSRKTNLQNWCNQNSKDYSSVEGQMAFFIHELQSSYSKGNGYKYPVYETLTQSTDVTECLEMFFCHAEAGYNVTITDSGEYAAGTGSTAKLFGTRKTYATAYEREF